MAAYREHICANIPASYLSGPGFSGPIIFSLIRHSPFHTVESRHANDVLLSQDYTMQKPLVALVGRPNVGKSTLFNRLVGERKSVTSDIPGTTRDRILADSDWRGVEFTVVDTGGIEVYEPSQSRNISPLAEGSADFVPQIRAQALIAVEEADVVVMLVDAEQGITAADEEIAEILRKSDKPVLVAANKADSEKRRFDAIEFYALGVGEEVYPISAIHGTGTGDLQ